MKKLKTILEVKEDMGNNESRVIRGIYLTDSGYWWVTSVRSGVCQKLSTAEKKIK